MAGTGPEDLHALALEFLQVATDALDTIPVYNPLLLGAPDRRFVSPGLPVDDCCDQLTVFVPTVNDAPTTPGGLDVGKRHIIGKINHASFQARATRCIPTGETAGGGWDPPSAESLEAAAEQINADGWALWNYPYDLLRQGLWRSLCSEVEFVSLVSVPPSGGCAGWLLTITANLDGYVEESLGS